MTSPATTAREARQLTLLGVVFLVVLGLLVWLSIASYRHVFADEVEVTFRARHAGHQLNVGGDVRMNGAIVGRVSGIDKSRSGAAVSLQVERGAAARIPTDVAARILPTTLFGQKFVELHSSSTTEEGHLTDGARIREDRSQEAVEVTTVLNDLHPVLTAVKPVELASSLNAVAGGLEGRGAELRRTMAGGGRYLARINAESEAIEADIRLFRKVARHYDESMPTFLSLLRHSTGASRSVIVGEDTIPAFIEAVTSGSRSGEELLRATEHELEASTRLSRPTMQLLAEYSPEFVCVIDGFLAVERSSAAQVRGNRFQGHFTMGASAEGYTLADRLELGDLGTGPHCRGLPRPPVPYPGFKLNDGVEQ